MTVAILHGGPFHDVRLEVNGVPPAIGFHDPDGDRVDYDLLAVMPGGGAYCYGYRAQGTGEAPVAQPL